MRRVNHVDFLLYDHLTAIFRRRWAAAVGKEADLARLHAIRAKLVEACEATVQGGAGGGNGGCPPAITTEEAEYTNHLIKRAIP